MPRRTVVFLVFLGAYFLSYFFRSTNAVIAGDLSRDMELSASQLGFMTSLFFLIFALAQLPIGAALDRFGARRTTSTLMLAGVAGNLLFSVAPSFPLLALGRALIGLGMAGVLMGALKAFSTVFAAERFAQVSSIFVGLGSLGALAAATPLTLLNSAFGWRTVFAGGAAVILASALLVARFGHSPAITTAKEKDKGGFSALFHRLDFWRIALLNFAVGGTLFTYQALWAGPFLSDVRGLDEVAVGNLLLLMGLGVMAGYFLMGRLSGRVGVPVTLVLGATVLTLVQVALALTSPTWPHLVLAILLVSFGIAGAFNVLTFAHVRFIFPLSMTGRAITAMNIFGIGGSALLQWSLGVVIGLYPLVDGGRHPPEAYRISFLLTAGLTALACTLYLPLVRRPQ